MEFQRATTGLLGFGINEAGVVQKVDGLAKSIGLQVNSKILQVGCVCVCVCVHVFEYVCPKIFKPLLALNFLNTSLLLGRRSVAVLAHPHSNHGPVVGQIQTVCQGLCCPTPTSTQKVTISVDGNTLSLPHSLIHTHTHTHTVSEFPSSILISTGLPFGPPDPPILMLTNGEIHGLHHHEIQISL